jgi:predicted thioredoxin/glutaredoxin
MAEMLSGPDGQHLLRRIALGGVRESFWAEPKKLSNAEILG